MHIGVLTYSLGGRFGCLKAYLMVLGYNNEHITLHITLFTLNRSGFALLVYELCL